MAAGDVGASSFEFYEGIRILIPGAVVVGLYSAVTATFGIETPPSDALVLLGGTLVAGLMLYFVDAPSKSAVFGIGLPSDTMKEWPLALPEGFRITNLFFIILDERMPAGIRNRALYTGSIFRIGFESSYLLFLVSSVVLAVAPFVSGGPHRDAVRHGVLFAAIAGYVTLVIAAVALEYLNARRPRRPDGEAINTRSDALSRVMHNLASGTPPLDRALLVVGGLCVAAYYLLTRSGALLVVAAAVPALLWSLRYHRGYRRERPAAPWTSPIKRIREYHSMSGRARRNVSASVAAMHIALTGTVLCLLLLTELPFRTVLSTQVTISWLGANLAAGLLVVARGHERRLYASYQTQRAWLELHRGRLINDYGNRVAG